MLSMRGALGDELDYASDDYGYGRGGGSLASASRMSDMLTTERGVDYHLDFYDTNWWVFKELELMDCVGEGKRVKLRDQWFTVPARPETCVEKLYGADWKTPKGGLNGVN